MLKAHATQAEYASKVLHWTRSLAVYATAVDIDLVGVRHTLFEGSTSILLKVLLTMTYHGLACLPGTPLAAAGFVQHLPEHQNWPL